MFFECWLIVYKKWKMNAEASLSTGGDQSVYYFSCRATADPCSLPASRHHLIHTTCFNVTLKQQSSFNSSPIHPVLAQERLAVDLPTSNIEFENVHQLTVSMPRVLECTVSHLLFLHLFRTWVHFAFQLTGMILLGGWVLQSPVMVVLEALDFIFLVLNTGSWR